MSSVTVLNSTIQEYIGECVQKCRTSKTSQLIKIVPVKYTLMAEQPKR